MDTQVVEKKTRYTTIKIPVELRDAIKRLAERFGVSEARVVWWAVSFYEEQLKKPKKKEDLPALDKASWYISKLAMSVGAFKENPSEENLRRLENTCQQISERLGVDTGLVLAAARDYTNPRVKAEDAELRMEINAAVKIVVLEIIYNLVLQEAKQE